MTGKEKEAVKVHINKTAGWNENSKGFQAIKYLFSKNEWDFWLLLEVQLYKDLAEWLRLIGLKVEIRADRVILTDDAVVAYYENVIGLKAEPLEDKSYVERYNINVKDKN